MRGALGRLCCNSRGCHGQQEEEKSVFQLLVCIPEPGKSSIAGPGRVCAFALSPVWPAPMISADKAAILLSLRPGGAQHPLGVTIIL